MSIQQAKDKLVKWAVSQIGYREGENNYNKYAGLAELRRLYGWNVQNNPWCDVFVDAGFIICFGYDAACAMTYQFSGCGGAACAKSADYYKAHSAFKTTPEVGDQVFFYSNGGINHTGIVTKVGMGAIEVVEGNSSDRVQRCTYSLNHQSIAGYGRPNWAVIAQDSDKANNVTTTPVVSGLPMLKRGDRGEVVRAAQLLLIGRGFSCGTDGADGDFGYNTHNATINFQRENVLEIDGIIGQATWSKLLGL